MLVGTKGSRFGGCLYKNKTYDRKFRFATLILFLSALSATREGEERVDRKASENVKKNINYGR